VQQKTNVARVHEKFKNQYKDFNHQVTARLVKKHHTAFVIEGLIAPLVMLVGDSSFCSYHTNASEPERSYTKLAAINQDLKCVAVVAIRWINTLLCSRVGMSIMPAAS
jgi:hypothetical protein